MLSTPPAFNLSQNQTLQFKSVQDSCFRRNRNLKDFLPTRYSLVNEPLGHFGPPSFRAARRRFMPPFVLAVNNFFSIPPNLFRRRCFKLYSVLVRTVETYAPLRSICQSLFCFPKIFPSQQCKVIVQFVWARETYAPLCPDCQSLIFALPKWFWCRKVKSLFSFVWAGGDLCASFRTPSITFLRPGEICFACVSFQGQCRDRNCTIGI